MASFTKLKNGDWGVRGAGSAPAIGDSVTVIKADGSRSKVTIANVIARYNDGNWIAAIAPKAIKATVQGGRCRASGCNGTARASGYCRQCEFDEFDN